MVFREEFLKFPLGWGLQVCDFLDWLLVKVTEWCSRSLVLSLKLLFFTWMRVLVPMCVCAKSLQACLTLCDPMDCSPSGSSVHGDSPGKNTGVGCHFLLQGIFPTQRPNWHLLCLLHWQVGSLPVVLPGKPFIYSTVSNFLRVNTYACVKWADFSHTDNL